MSHIQAFRGALRCLVAAAVALTTLHAAAGIEGSWGQGGPTDTAPKGNSTRSFYLYTGEGHISAADGQQIYMWGYTDDINKPMQYPGPTLKMRAGDKVRITLDNRLPVRTSLIFPGQVMTGGGAGNGTANVLADFANAAGTTNTSMEYTFTASEPGTYTYQSGSDNALQAEMGLVGTIIVYPADANGLKKAYNHAATAFDRENLFVVTDVDSAIHAAVDERITQLRAGTPANCLSTPSGCTNAIRVDMSKRFPDYWFLNGRTAPDVFAANYVDELPLQPYNTLPRVHPGDKILLRMVGAGNDMHPMHHHGNNSWAIARDGRMLSTEPLNAAGPGPNLAVSDFTIPITPGQTYDAIWSWTGKGIGWDIFGAKCNSALSVSASNCRFGTYLAAGHPTNQLAACLVPAEAYASCPSGRYQSPQDPATDLYKLIPVKLPSELELAYGEFYSGSPYLGDFGIRPVGAGAVNTTGAFFHIFHSHNEREIVNGGVFIGGMMTMLVVEPFSVSID